MRMLATRLKRLEKRRRPRRIRRTTILAINHKEAPGPVIALCVGERRVERVYGEAWEPFAARCAAELSHPILIAAYGPPEPPRSASASSAPSIMPPAPEAAASDPYALAGIGRIDERYRDWWKPDSNSGDD